MILAVRTALDDLAADVGWTHKEARWRSAAHVRLRLLSATRKGRDERRYAPEGSDDIRERVYGVRVLRIQVTCEAQDQDLVASAWDLAERVSTGMHEADVVAVLDTAGIGLASITAPTGVDYMDAHRRTRSAVVFDLALNAHTSQVGPLVPRVKSLEFTGTIENGPDIGPEIVSEP
jgi:hypothetical protein